VLTQSVSRLSTCCCSVSDERKMKKVPEVQGDISFRASVNCPIVFRLGGMITQLFEKTYSPKYNNKF